MPQRAKGRMTQEERSAQSRNLLINGAIEAIHRAGYNGASTALIAEIAGVSRGSFQHQFKTRAALMAEVVNAVFQQEMADYELVRGSGAGGHVYDWPRILWAALSKPSGVAVLEILLAAQSDDELAAEVRPMQARVEEQATNSTLMAFGGDVETAKAVMRLMVWTARGLSVAGRVMPGEIEPEPVIDLLGVLLKLAAPNGRLDNIKRLLIEQTTCSHLSNV